MPDTSTTANRIYLRPICMLFAQACINMLCSCHIWHRLCLRKLTRCIQTLNLGRGISDVFALGQGVQRGNAKSCGCCQATSSWPNVEPTISPPLPVNQLSCFVATVPHNTDILRSLIGFCCAISYTLPTVITSSSLQLILIPAGPATSSRIVKRIVG